MSVPPTAPSAPPSEIPPEFMPVDIGCLVSSTPSGYRRRMNQYRVVKIGIRPPEKGVSSKVNCPVCGKPLGLAVRSKTRTTNQFTAILVVAAILAVGAVLLNAWEVAIAPALVAILYVFRLRNVKPNFILPSNARHKYWQSGKPVTRTGTWLLLGGFAVFCGMAYGVAQADTRHAREAVVGQYGDAAVQACSRIEPKNYNNGKLPAGKKLVFINASSSLVFDYYQAAIPAANKATGKSDVTAVVCILESGEATDVDQYDGGSTCTHMRRKHDVFVMDLSTSKQVSHSAFLGDDDAVCPESITVSSRYGVDEKKHIEQYGSNPAAGPIISWVLK